MKLNLFSTVARSHWTILPAILMTSFVVGMVDFRMQDVDSRSWEQVYLGIPVFISVVCLVFAIPFLLVWVMIEAGVFGMFLKKQVSKVSSGHELAHQLENAVILTLTAEWLILWIPLILFFLDVFVSGHISMLVTFIAGSFLRQLWRFSLIERRIYKHLQLQRHLYT